MSAASIQHTVVTSIDDFGTNPTASAVMAPKLLRTTPVRVERASITVRDAILEVTDRSFPLVTQGETLPGRVSFVTPLAPSVMQMNGEAMVPRLLHSFGEGAEVRGTAQSPHRCGVLSVPLVALKETARALDADVDPPGHGEFRVLRTHEWVRLRSLFERLLLLARAGPERPLATRQADALGATMLEFAVHAFDRGHVARQSSAAHLNSMHITRICEDYAATTQYHDVTMTALCASTGVSERRVRQAFYDAYGMSPTAYLRVAALHRLRRALLDGPSTRDAVSRTAADYGFWHLGHLARQYRALFGENPNETLSQRVPLAG